MFLSEKGLVKLGDLGLASQLNHFSSQRNSTCGTYIYFPPETCSGKSVLKSDVWALGISLFEFAEGENPYAVISKEASMMPFVTMDPLPSLSREKWSDECVDFVNRCLVKNVESRPSVAELMKERDQEESHE